jgi:hypothetical protein
MNTLTTLATTTDPWGPVPLATAYIIAMAIALIAYIGAGVYSEVRKYAPGVDSDTVAHHIRRPFAITAVALVAGFILVIIPVGVILA